MKTNDLIHVITQDQHSAPQRNLLGHLAIGVMVSFMGLLIAPWFFDFGVRPNYFAALGGVFVPLKQIVPMILAISLFPLVNALRFPETLPQKGILRLLPFIIISCALFVIGWLSTPDGVVAMAMKSKRLGSCMALIPVFSIPVFIGVMHALKSSAPTFIRKTGFYAGLLAGAVGCIVYAFSCVDDNPLFWSWAYSIGIAVCGIVGALIAPRVLKW